MCPNVDSTKFDYRNENCVEKSNPFSKWVNLLLLLFLAGSRNKVFMQIITVKYKN